MKNTVGIVIVAHSNSMTNNLIEFLEVLKEEDFELLNGGGENFDTYGTTEKILIDVVKKANRGKGVLILVDFGSSINVSRNVKNILKNEINVEIADAPLVEAAISIVVANDENMDLLSLKKIAEDSKNFKKIKE